MTDLDYQALIVLAQRETVYHEHHVRRGDGVRFDPYDPQSFTSMLAEEFSRRVEPTKTSLHDELVAALEGCLTVLEYINSKALANDVRTVLARAKGEGEA